MRIRFLPLLALALSPAAHAGNMDSHLTATHHLALLAGLSEADARLIASADWSMDLYARTEALPHVSPKGALNDGLYHAPKGYTFHSLGGSPEEVHERLQKMHAVISGDTDRETKLLHIGQYLHALQDVYFHTAPDGSPYEPMFGHLLGGHDTDKVALHFDGALRAYRETLVLMKAVAANAPVPPPPPEDQLFHLKQISRAELDAARADGTMALASAIARSYEPKEVALHGHGHTVKTKGDLEPNLEKLSASLSSLRPGAPPFLWLTAGSPEAIDYNANPQLLVIQPEDPYPEVTEAANAAAKGVSFTAAAASAIPLDVDLDGVRFVNGELVLSGEEGGALDAALVMTALRLACLGDDPYFSLDAVDPAGFVARSPAVFQGFENRTSELVPSLAMAADGSDEDAAGGVTTRVWSVSRLEPDRYRAVRDDPAMQTRLVFKPEWLRETRFGARMYAADVALKEMASGLTTSGGEPAMPERSPSGILRMAARGIVDPQTLHANNGTRLWFALPAPRQTAWWDVNVADFPDFTKLTGPRTVGDLVRRELAEENLVDDGLLATNGGTAPVHGGVVDLSAIDPVAHVRLHDIGTGADQAGSDPALFDLADEMNQRFDEFAAVQPAVEELREALRAYVLAVHVASQAPDLCKDVQRIPRLLSERLATPLPETHPPILVVASVALPLVYTDENGVRVQSRPYGIAGVVSGGVTLGGRTSVIPAATPSAVGGAIDAGLADRGGRSVWESDGRRFVALRLDTADAVARFRSIAFTPVTEEDVLAGRGGASLAASRPGRSFLASRWIGIAVAFVFAIFANAGAITIYRRTRRS